ncbi:TonB-dependent receptor [Desulfobacterales bacterium HSG16]|nr:TonB-dependent receptor [Desulfobacterales bacterium HSG16]
MKCLSKVFAVKFFILIQIFIFCVAPAIASGQETIDEIIDEELKWLKEETETQFVTVATKTKISVEDAPSIVSVITGKEIQNMGARNLIDVMRIVPGFDMTSKKKNYNSMYVRGTSVNGGVNKSIKVIIDGHALHPVGYDEFERLPVAGIKKIEIIRGPGSALYGSGAFLCVINIVTYKGGEKDSRISVEGGTFETMKPYAELSYGKDDFTAYFYADYYKTDGYEGKIESDAAANSPVIPNFGPLQVASESREMTNDNSFHTFRTHLDYKNFYVSGFLQKDDSKCPVGVQEVLTDEDDIDNLYSYAETGFKLPITDKGNLLMKMYFDYSYYYTLYEMLPEETAEKHIGFLPDEGLHFGAEGKYSILGGEITGDYEVYPGIHFIGGTSYENVRHHDIKNYANFNNTGLPIEVDGKTYSQYPPYERFTEGVTEIDETVESGYDKAKSDIFALYTQGTADIKSLFFPDAGFKTLSLTAGLRYDNYRNEGEKSGGSNFSSVNSRFGLAYAPTERLWFKILYGEAFRAPALKEAYFWGNAQFVQNKDIQPEQIATTEGLVGYRFTKNISASLTGFHIIAEDLIGFSMTEKGFGYNNTGKTKSVGAEFELKIGFDKNKYGFLNFTWQDVKDITNKEIAGAGMNQEDFSVGGAPEFYGNIGVNYDLTENIIANVSMNYLGQRERSEEKVWDGEKLVLKDTRDSLDAYWLFNTSLTFKNLLAKGLDFQISGFNLLDEDYRAPAPIGTLHDDIPSPRRSFTGRISYMF